MMMKIEDDGSHGDSKIVMMMMKMVYEKQIIVLQS